MLIVKSADQSKVSDITPAFDSELKVAIGANETWAIQLKMRHMAGSGTPDITFGMFGPTGSSGWWIENYGFFIKQALNTTIGASSFATEENFIIDAVCINGATPGDFGLQWCQRTSSPDFTRIMAQSWLIATKKI